MNAPAVCSPLSDHPLRRELNDEAHARPFEPLATPARLSFVAYLHRNASAEQEQWLVGELCAWADVPPPQPGCVHFSTRLGALRFKWARHAEYSSMTVIADGGVAESFAVTALAELPADWLAQLPGNVLHAAHALLLSDDALPTGIEEISARYFGGNDLIGAGLGDGAGRAFTDFRIGPDGFSRYVVGNGTMGRRQAGRMLQRLFEIDSYRMLALLALPVAKSISPELADADRELAELTSAMSAARQDDEPLLLDRLTQLAARIESALSRTDFRFSAAHAYHEIVRRRVAELRETRVQGVQPFTEFVERRLSPAMDTCESVARRQRVLAARVARASSLLRTRVEITHERQNQQLLASMDRRAHLQLRLQETVEGLSVAAITYYTVGLVGYLGKGVKAVGVPVDAELLTAIAIPVVALTVAWGLRRFRRSLVAQA
ncbi:hypothetical protein GCM10007860_00470 [Chitiniphilus shinanonensis]|uniref:Membrane-anchored protein n=1 Tax=Chitiniphilus shinanonensis TaxID=553088 RepID=A0ABQ6BSW6_9NEIS|nr:DUF3422 domain-containing protein [Chitiniphilus shinanonensis]GLS02904.1 hypothetical protein GCM10007860_00470 [Chitiniphilus shinanonensis]